jgi:GNAT superfamily N-acetyltransferase
MSDEGDDQLREMAANRGCKLVKSRLRTPGKGDYGRFGLKDAKTGKALIGIGDKGLTASPEEIIAFLRGGAASGWKSSVVSGGPTPSDRKAKAPVPAPKPKPRPKPPAIREARPKDAETIAVLIAALGYEVGAADVRKRLATLRRAGAEALIVERDKVDGILTISIMNVLHRPLPVGRISMMVIAESARGQGLGTLLVAAAEQRLKSRGCGMVEVTSNKKRLRAHNFYERLGYERTSYRFAKSI